MKHTDKRTLTVRIIAIIMAGLMLLGILTMLFNSAYAADEMMSITATGSQGTTKWPIFAAVGALVVIAVCVIIPKLNKKD